MQEKSQSSDFASSTGFTAKVCNLFPDQIVEIAFVCEMYHNCFHVLRFHLFDSMTVMLFQSLLTNV